MERVLFPWSSARAASIVPMEKDPEVMKTMLATWIYRLLFGKETCLICVAKNILVCGWGLCYAATPAEMLTAASTCGTLLCVDFIWYSGAYVVRNRRFRLPGNANRPELRLVTAVGAVLSAKP